MVLLVFMLLPISNTLAFDGGEEMKGNEVHNKNLEVISGYTVNVYGKNAGTLVFEITKKEDSEWNGTDKVTPYIRYLNNYSFKSEADRVEQSEEKVTVYEYVANPSTARYLFLNAQEGEFGYDPFEYKAFYVEGEDLTKQTTPTTTPTLKTQKVYWDGAELKKGQIGRITVQTPINLWKRNADNSLEFSRILWPGERYRVYCYDNLYFGQYGLGGGYYITKMNGYIKYETPSKSKLDLLYNR